MSAVGIKTNAASSSNISTANAAVVNLSLDRDAFFDALTQNLNAVKTAIVGDWATVDGQFKLVNGGAFSRAELQIENALSGYFELQSKSYDNQISRLNDRIKSANNQITRYKAMLERKFSAMESIISAMQKQYSSMNLG